MKQLTIIIAFIVLWGCQETTETSNPFEDFNTNKEMADRAYNLFEAGDLENMAAMWSEDMFWSPANTNDSLSKDQWKQAMKGWHAEFENFKFSDRQYYPGVDEEFVPNGSVRVYGTWSSTHKATGKNTETKYYAVIEYDDDNLGKGTMEWFDLGGVYDQVQEEEEE